MIWTLPAPAKLNLFLHITGVRDDGYHNLQTIFQLLDYSDEVTLLRRDDGVIRRTEGLADVAPSDDLIVKAAHALKNYSGTHYGADVGVIKRLPVGGGIGGGSSDAATTLLGLNALWGCELPTESLLEIAVTLGADVPVFVAGQSAWAEGIGEQLTAMELPEIWFLVLHPGVFVSTAKLFSSEVLTRNKSILKMRDFTDTDIENIFENLVREQHSEVSLSLDWLSQFSTARMTGTGSCIFAGFSSYQEAEFVFDKMPKKWTGFIAKAINTSPVFEAIKQCSKRKK